MKETEYRELKRHARQSRIFVQAKKYDPRDPANINVPIPHKDRFAALQSLGRTSYFTYGFTLNNDTLEKPWQLENKRQATTLVHLAAKCRRENRNESGWRNEVEFRLFQKFDMEVSW